ncbi:MAG: DUF3854 domain-containing protein [Proteobacteria bacterium]|nr:MAG: DUF3854 domain-containing protein [Pseudomonadota bacterium]
MVIKFTARQMQNLLNSGVTEDVARLCRLSCIYDVEEMQKLLRVSSPRPVPALMIPYYPMGRFDEAPMFCRVRPDEPDTGNDGKVRKYLQPLGMGTKLYFPPIISQEGLYSVDVPLYLTEGEKKAIAACARGYVCIAASGVQNFHDAQKSDSRLGINVLKEELLAIPLRDRDVYIVFDALKFRNPMVLKAEIKLAQMLHQQGARVHIVHIPSLSSSGDTGLDDLLLAMEGDQ